MGQLLVRIIRDQRTIVICTIIYAHRALSCNISLVVDNNQLVHN
jgi:hypothetical protein